MTTRRTTQRRASWRLIPLLALGLAALPSTGARGLAAESVEFAQKVVLQNDRVRGVMNVYPAGTSSPEHEHVSPRVVVVVEGGTLEIRDASGRVSTLSLKNGDIVWRPPEKHTVANVGSTPIRLVEIDVKDCPEK